MFKLKKCILFSDDYIDVNEHERLSNFTHWKQIKVKEQCLYCSSTF
jgi:hypothetical protein